MQVVPVEEEPVLGVVVGVTEQPAPASGVVVGVVVTEQPGASSGGAARGYVDQTQQNGNAMLTKDLWMAGDAFHGLDLGAGRWRHAEQQHWISDYHSDAIAGDGHLHLWANERSHWYVTSSMAWESFKQHPEGGTGGEYPWVISDDGPRGTPVGSYQSGGVRFSVYTQQDHEQVAGGPTSGFYEDRQKRLKEAERKRRAEKRSKRFKKLWQMFSPRK